MDPGREVEVSAGIAIQSLCKMQLIRFQLISDKYAAAKDLYVLCINQERTGKRPKISKAFRRCGLAAWLEVAAPSQLRDQYVCYNQNHGTFVGIFTEI